MPSRPNVPLAAIARDAVYVAVGLGVVLFQKSQVQRRACGKELERRFAVVGECLSQLGPRVARPPSPPRPAR